MSCSMCGREICAFDKFMNIKGLLFCEDCASPTYDHDCDGKKCFVCKRKFDPDTEEVVDICDGDYLCSECAKNELEEYDPEGDAADDWYEWSRDELRGY